MAKRKAQPETNIILGRIIGDKFTGQWGSPILSRQQVIDMLRREWADYDLDWAVIEREALGACVLPAPYGSTWQVFQEVDGIAVHNFDTATASVKYVIAQCRA